MKYLIVSFLFWACLLRLGGESVSDLVTASVKEKFVSLEPKMVLVAVGFFDPTNDETYFEGSTSARLSDKEMGGVLGGLKRLEFAEAKSFFVADQGYLLVFLNPGEEKCLALHHDPADGSDSFRPVTVRFSREGNKIEVLERLFLTKVVRDPAGATERQLTMALPGWARSEVGKSVIEKSRGLLRTLKRGQAEGLNLGPANNE